MQEKENGRLNEKYQRTFQGMDCLLHRRKKEERLTALGYTSNLDLICDFQAEGLNSLLRKHMPGAVLSEMKPAERIQTIEELLETLVYYCSRGVGGEVEVENTSIIEDSFLFTYGMGGTAVQAALALSEAGCGSVVHLTDDSKEVCRLLDTPFVYTVSKDGKLIHSGEVVQVNGQEIHFIIQFKKGDKIRTENDEICIPCSNRLILTKITVNQHVPFYKPYFKWLEEHADKVGSNVLSGFNTLIDEKVLRERLEHVKEHVTKYRANNPSGIVFFENAFYRGDGMQELCLEVVCPYVDIVSLNEEELSYTLKMYGFEVDMEDIVSCVEGVKYMRDKLKIRKGVIVHTKDYAMYVGIPLEADIEMGLMLGNMLATAKALNGCYGTKEQIAQVLDLGLSPKGVLHYNRIIKSSYANEAILVPSRYIDKPQYTIGLGDSFVGGVQICF